MTKTKAEYQAEWVKNNPEKAKEISRNYYYRNREKRIQSAQEWRKKNPEKIKNNSLKYDFGFSFEEYSALLEKQNFSCAICGRHQSEFKLSLAVDHCHISGKVRGLLCSGCNVGLGHYEKKHNKFKQYLESMEITVTEGVR